MEITISTDTLDISIYIGIYMHVPHENKSSLYNNKDVCKYEICICY